MNHTVLSQTFKQ